MKASTAMEKLEKFRSGGGQAVSERMRAFGGKQNSALLLPFVLSKGQINFLKKGQVNQYFCPKEDIPIL